MHCMKLLGLSLMARGFERQVAEIQILIAVLNRYTVLGIPITEPVWAKSVWGKGQNVHHSICTTKPFTCASLQACRNLFQTSGCLNYQLRL
jgi:hypothetical protein